VLRVQRLRVDGIGEQAVQALGALHTGHRQRNLAEDLGQAIATQGDGAGGKTRRTIAHGRCSSEMGAREWHALRSV